MLRNNVFPLFKEATPKTQWFSSAFTEKQSRIQKRTDAILVVDDDPSVLETVSACLKKEGSSVTKASDGQAALEAIKKNCFDLIITDFCQIFGIAD